MEKSQNWEDPSQDLVTMIMLDPKLDLFNAQRENYKREKKLYIQLHYMKLTLSIVGPKDS